MKYIKIVAKYSKLQANNLLIQTLASSLEYIIKTTCTVLFYLTYAFCVKQVNIVPRS